MGWLFDAEQTNREQVRARPAEGPATSSGSSPAVPAAGVASRCSLPAAARRPGHLVVAGALTAFFWAALVRVALLHHVTWSINSICHTIGERPFVTRDKSAQLLVAGDPVAAASPGTTCTTPTRPAPGTACCAARSTSAPGVIWVFEKLGWAHDVRWPDAGAARRPARPDAAAMTASVTTGSRA